MALDRLEVGAVVDATDKATQQTALMWAVRSNNAAAVRLFLPSL